MVVALGAHLSRQTTIGGSCRRDFHGDGTVLLEGAVKGPVVVLSEEPRERQRVLSSGSENALTHLPGLSHHLDG